MQRFLDRELLILLLIFQVGISLQVIILNFLLIQHLLLKTSFLLQIHSMQKILILDSILPILKEQNANIEFMLIINSILMKMLDGLMLQILLAFVNLQLKINISMKFLVKILLRLKLLMKMVTLDLNRMISQRQMSFLKH